MPPPVKRSTAGDSRRRYDSTARRARAAARREAVVEVARTRFLARGFTATTVAEVAAEAEVSVESIYKWFGTKAGLLKAVWDRSLAGSGTTHAELRSDAGSRSATDARSILRNWARLAAEVGAVGDPVYRLIESAAYVDPEAASLYAGIEGERAARMEHNAAYLVDRGYLREDVTAAQARDVLMLYSTFYERLVTKAGWSPEEFSAFIERGLAAHLLP
ncbi:TetR/AcrR family transcriptional regulator [Terrabacter terrae]|uniref:TetR/AcrR family transcriptional regulator n=1 Tax=Terrabacter terrae TaxID=318434 RepID=A0ABN2UKS8_9MICO